MVIALQAAIGGILWTLLFSLVIVIFGGIFYIANKEKIEKNKRRKWDGKPIVVEGGKEND
jgi:hypothetical protein